MQIIDQPDSGSLYQTTYDREQCQCGIVHLGYGAFHRAHQAVYIDDYMEQTGNLNWGIAAVNLRQSESETFARSSRVENGYLVRTTEADGKMATRLVRSHIKYIDWSLESVAAEALLENPEVRLITITVTESGYYLDQNSDLDLTSTIIAGEISGKKATTVYGYLANALTARMQNNAGPLSILCCDNIRSNGHMMRCALVSYLEAAGRERLANWVVANARFPCSVVDRITPRVTAELREEITNQYGDSNLDPVHSERYCQWVLEKDFAVVEPDLGAVGVELVSDVDPFEEAKIRILNGGHTGLAYLGTLAGYQTFDQAFQDPALRGHFDNYQQQEVLPGLTVELPFEKQIYLAEVTSRFHNRAIADQLERICMDGYSKVQIYIRPTLASCLGQGIDPVHGYDCIASWYVYARRKASGQLIDNYQEPYWSRLAPLLESGQEATFASQAGLWGDLPEKYSGFVPGIVNAIQKMKNLWPA